MDAGGKFMSISPRTSCWVSNANVDLQETLGIHQRLRKNLCIGTMTFLALTNIYFRMRKSL